MRYWQRHLLILILFTLTANNLSAQLPDLVKYVNTLQGTNSTFELSRGNTYPTIALPFGMNAWSAQTGKNGDGWKYQYFLDSIRGFQQVHQCSPWVNDYNVFSLMPVTGNLVVREEKRAAKFTHQNEIARPDYYKVKFENGISTEIAPAERSAHMRFSFPKNKNSYVIFDGYTKMSSVTIDPSERRITGWIYNGYFTDSNLRSYFIIQFDQPFTSFGTWENVQNTISATRVEDQGKGVGAYIEFKAGSSVQAKVSSSYIGLQQAETTLAHELGSHRRLEDTRNAAFEVWNKLLNRVFVEGGTEEEKATFYSCLFRASLFSRDFFEINKDGQPYYRSPYDNKVHEGYMYTDNGFWDTFRGEFPLHNILYPEKQGRYMQALLDAQQQCGWLPSWSFPRETGGMLGNHAISLLTDAWAKGIRTFNPDSALKAYLHEATNKGPWGGANGRQGWKNYFQLGYVAFPGSSGATSQTLEYAYNDWCAYRLADLTGNGFYREIFKRQMYNYRNVYDSSTGFMRGRGQDGKWTPGFDPFEWGGPFTEGNAWHWQWSVFHDIEGLIKLMGGEENFYKKLDSVWTSPNTVNVGSYKTMIHEMKEMQLINMGQYAHGNQPIQHMIYLYNYCRQPWKAQYHVRQVMDKIYNAGENGFPGDEDQGQTSAWYVLSAMGFYSVCPGTDEYVIGSPVFNKITITQENNKKFIIEAKNNTRKNVYIKSALLNGKTFSRNYIRHSEITDGGILSFEMSDKPAFDRGTGDEDKPYSLSK